MNTIAFYTLYDDNNQRPCCAGIKIDDKVTIYDLFRNTGKPIAPIYKSIRNIKDFILKVVNTHKIITTDFKRSLKTYDILLDQRKINVYDLNLEKQLASVRSTGNQAKDHVIVRRILDKMCKTDCKSYQKLLADASVVYEDIERRGLIVNDTLLKSQWSTHTYSGRSKSTDFNIQGHSDSDIISTPAYTIKPVLLHFDWIAADIRVAALMSGDEKLLASFKESDPYTYMMQLVNGMSKDKLTRSECKLALLKAINSMDLSSVVLGDVYPDLGKWIHKCEKVTTDQDGVLHTILGRPFKMSQSKNALAMLNGVMQGSVVHAMQSVIRQVWEKLSQQFVAEIHDSIIMCCPQDNMIIRSTINIVTEIMLHPFKGLLDSNPAFPLKVSIGKKWKQWQLLETHREGGVIHARKADETAAA